MSLHNRVPRIAAHQASKNQRVRQTKPRRFRPLLETLEDRYVPSFMVTNLLDDGSAGCLRSQINAAEQAGPGNTVTFQQGLNGTIALQKGELSLNTGITIDGSGANISISGLKTNPVFRIVGTASQPIAVNMKDLTIEDGLSTGSVAEGGGMYIYLANVTLNQCKVINNEALGGLNSDTQGGGIFVLQGQLLANQCDITDNTADGGLGGANSAQGGGIYANESSVQLTHGTLLRNKAVGGFGGAVGLNAAGRPGGNAAGGALYVNNGGPVFLQNEEIDNNAALGGRGASGSGTNGLPGGNAVGGALYISSITPTTIFACPSHNNTAQGGDGGEGAGGFVGGTGGRGGDAQGGWLYAAGTQVSMDAKALQPPYIIFGNQSLGGGGGAGGAGAFQGGQGGQGGNGQGGAIYAYQTDDVDLPKKFAIPLSFNQPWGLIDNTAQGGAGGRGGVGGAGGMGGKGGDAQGGGVDLIQTNGIVTGFVGLNTAQGGQGGFGGNGSNIAGNGGNGGDALGGALYDEHNDVLNPKSGSLGAGISTGPFGIWLNAANGGHGGDGGTGPNGGNGGNGGSGSGGAFDAGPDGNFDIAKDFLQYNSANGGAGGNGGGITTDAGQAGLGGAGGSAQGGAVNLDHGIVNLLVSTVTSNRSAGGHGGEGGPAWNGSAGSGGNGGVGGSTLGGALAAEDSKVVNLMNDVLDDNHALGGSGGDGADGVGFSNVDDGGNGGNGSNGGAGQGGCIGVSGDSTVGVLNTTLSNNSAKGGDGGWGGSTFELYFIPPGFAGNGAAGGNGDGGGLFASSGKVKLVNNTLSGNVAQGGQGGGGGDIPDYNGTNDGGNGGDGGEGRGGGLAAEGADFLLVNNTFNGDRAQGGNGGSGGNSGSFDIAGTGGNGQSGEGGAIYTKASTLQLINDTIDGNRAASGNAGLGGYPTNLNGVQLPSFAGGIFVDLGPNIHLTNTIVAQDQADSDPDISGFIQSGDHDLIGDGTGAFFVTSKGDQIGGTNGNPVLDPKLTSLGNYGGPTKTMIPQSGSPVIDTGDDAALSLIAADEGLPQATDQRGFQRPVGLHIDIGATEYGVGPTTPQPGNPPNGAPGIGPSGNGAIVPPGILHGHRHLRDETVEDFDFASLFTADFLEDLLLVLRAVDQEASFFTPT